MQRRAEGETVLDGVADEDSAASGSPGAVDGDAPDSGAGHQASAERIGPPQPGVRAVELGEDISLYNPRTQGVALLNGTASDVWRLADGEHTLEEIVALLGAVYDAEPDLIRQGVVQTVTDLVAGGFL